MFGLLSRIFSSAGNPHDPAEERRINGAIEAIVAGTDARLKFVPDYAKMLSGPAATSIAHVRRIVDNLRPSVALSPEGYGADPRVHLLFGSVDSMKQIVGRDAAFRTYERDDRGTAGGHAFALLTAEREIKHVLGMELQGEIVLRDVAKAVVVYSNRRLHALAAAEEETLRLIRIGAFRRLVKSALARLVRAKAGSPIVEPAADGQTQHPTQAIPPWHADDCSIAEIDERLARLGPSALTLRDYLEIVGDVLARPQEHLRQTPFSAVVDRMGALIEHPEEAGTNADPVLLWDIFRPDRNPVTTVLVRLRSDDFPPIAPPVEWV